MNRSVGQQASPPAPSSQDAAPPTRVEEDRPLAEVRKNLNEIWRMVSLHRWMFFIPFCIVSSGAFVASLYYPRTYRATTTFERKNDPIMMNVPMSAGAASFKLFRNTIVRDLTSTSYMSEVVEKIGLLDHAERDENGKLTPASEQLRTNLARSLGGTLTISTSSPSELIDVIRITYTGPDPKIGKKLVEQAKHTYVHRTMEWIHEFLVKQRDYFRNEAKLATEELRVAQLDEMKLKLNHPLIASGDASQIASRMTQLEAERRGLELRQREYQGELDAHRESLAAIGDHMPITPTGDSGSRNSYGSVPASAASVRLLGQIASVTAKIESLRQDQGMTDHHPTVVAQLKVRSVLEQRLAKQRELDKKLGEANADLTLVPQPAEVALTPEAREWQRGRNQLLVKISAQQQKLREIEIDLETNREATERLLDAKTQLFDRRDEFDNILARVIRCRQRLAQHEETLAGIEPVIKTIEQGRLLQFSEGSPPIGGATPISPKSASIVVLALLAGLAAGVIFVILAELVDGVYRSSAHVAKSLGLPVLESIDEIVTGPDKRRILVQRAVVSPLIVACCLGMTGLAGSMAYLSLRRPWTYERIRSIPQAALELFIDSDQPEATPGS